MELAEVYTKFRKSLFTYIYGKVNNREDAEDILQNVFLKMHTNIGTLSDKEKITNWLYRITRNSIIDYYRTTKNKKKKLEFSEKLPADLMDEENDDNTKGMDKCLGGFIKQLPEEYKSIIIDSEIKGIPQKELSSKYDLAYPTVRSRVQRGRERLHKMFTNCCSIQTDSRGNIIEASLKKENCQISCNSCN
ncbi:MAG: subfamily polymerase sigma-24 subunit [Bacteroidetes bacterium]|jgi:RNA polymerase sigma-70 factor (ECF subfamily)|nr:subfamily polymerase sigma-24 subunit [Bacteroidota bacterium]